MSKIIPRSNIAPSPIAASPGSSDAGSPAAGAGSLGGGGNAPAMIVTSKEWVLPPRPKPGRKPSADTPASKRKAQNRAAQRAFRERRATRVQELEAQLMEVEKERDIKEMGLVNMINKLKVENQFLVKNIEKLRTEMNFMKSGNMNNFAANTTSSPHTVGSPAGSSSSYSVQQISPAPSGNSPPVFQSNFGVNLTPVSNSESNKNDLEDCGVCVKEECFCEEVGLKSAKPPQVSLEQAINSVKPTEAVSLKRKFSDNKETDFTKRYSTKKRMPDLTRLMKKPTKQTNNDKTNNNKNNNDFMEMHGGNGRGSNGEFNEDSPVENCGFCTDDTPCVCREAAKEAALLNESLHEGKLPTEDTSLPPILNTNSFSTTAPLPVMHPGPSVEIRDISNLSPGAVPTVIGPTNRSSSLANLAATAESMKPEPVEKPSGCTGNPGTCDQCQMDPMSTLFCTTVANIEKDSTAKGETSQSTPPSTVGSSTTPGGSTRGSISSPASGMFIPCSDAYKTLSRHKKFNSVDFSTLVGKLTTRGMQVEVQSVANVLRELDRRLYS
ncbi:hypothetical protein CAAN1_27S00980 [[Candida] anglica]|uniref:BZIP domain-containing protein n=1 Tax=[Candida] anglica TaxID=148631 RepID=A0ABP0E7R4_9ASCO